MKRRINSKNMLIVTLLVTLCILVMGNSYVFADELISGDYAYKILEDGTAEITDYTGSAVDLTIPDKIDGYQVTVIGQWAFFKCTNLQSVVIPEGVTTIGEFAFDHCDNLEKVTIPESVINIGPAVFNYCRALKYVNIPEGIEELDGTFFMCESLENIEIPNSVTVIGGGTFGYCSKIEKIKLPDKLITIGDSAFFGCSALSEIIIPEAVNSIDSQAFRTCNNIKSIFIPKNVAFIGEDVFSGADQLEYIEVSPDNSVYTSENGVLFSKDMKQLILYPVQKKDSEYIVPDGVVEIGKDAFYKCENINKLTVPKGVKSIKESALGGCSNLKEIYLPKSIVEIDGFSLGDCAVLSDVYYDGNIFEWDFINMSNSTKELLETANIHYAEEVIINTQTPSPTETTTATEIPKQDENILGYVDENDTIDAKDALLVLQYAAKLTDFIENQITSADVDKSGNVNATDALYILQYSARIIDNFDIIQKSNLQELKDYISENGQNSYNGNKSIRYNYVENNESYLLTEIDEIEYDIRKDSIKYTYTSSGNFYCNYAEYTITINKKSKVEVRCHFKEYAENKIEDIEGAVSFELNEYYLEKTFTDALDSEYLRETAAHLSGDALNEWVEEMGDIFNAHVHLALLYMGDYLEKTANINLSDLFNNYVYSSETMNMHLNPIYGYSEKIDNYIDLLTEYLNENGYIDGSIKYFQDETSGASWIYDIDDSITRACYDPNEEDLYFEMDIMHEPVNYNVHVEMRILPNRTSHYIVTIYEPNEEGVLEFKQQLETTLESRKLYYLGKYDFTSLYPMDSDISDEYIQLASYDVYKIYEGTGFILQDDFSELNISIKDLGFKYHISKMYR